MATSCPPLNNRMLRCTRKPQPVWLRWAGHVVRQALHGEGESSGNVSKALFVLLTQGRNGFVAFASGDQVDQAMLVRLVERGYARDSETLATRLKKLFALLDRHATERGLDTTTTRSELTKAALRSFGQGGAAHVLGLCTDPRDVSDYALGLESPPPCLFGLFALTLYSCSCRFRRGHAMVANAQDVARSFLERDGLSKWLTSLKKKLDSDSDSDSSVYSSVALWWLLSHLAHEEFVAKARQNLTDLAGTVAALAKSKCSKTVCALRTDLAELGNDADVGATLATAAARDFNLGSKDWLEHTEMTALLCVVLTNTPAARKAFLDTSNDE